MIAKILTLTLIAGLSAQLCGDDSHKYVPEEGSPELEHSISTSVESQGKMRETPSCCLPKVLVLGDSISMGYTAPLKKLLEGQAEITHNPGNSQGTTHTLALIDEWLSMGDWDVIHFNLGLHDLKRVKVAGTGANSDNPNDPYQADLDTYAKNMELLVEKLEQTNARLIFATTTPFPAGVSPYRDPDDVEKYNSVALAIMKRHGIEIDDLYTRILPKLDTLQKPENVHFTPEGSYFLATQVAKSIADALPQKKRCKQSREAMHP